MTQIIETTSNQLFLVRETGDTATAHLWVGVPVKRVKGGGLTPKANAREQLVRKEGSRLIAKGA